MGMDAHAVPAQPRADVAGGPFLCPVVFRERRDRLGPLDRAVRGYRRFGTLKSILKVPFFAGVIVLTVIAYRHYGILGGAAMLIVGTPALMGVFSVVVVLPLGYAFCGRDAMRLGQQLIEARDRGHN